MRLCLSCFHLWPASCLVCGHCRRSFGGRVCRRRHLSPAGAQFCTQCGAPELTDPTPYVPLGWLPRLLAWLCVFWVARWFWQTGWQHVLPLAGSTAATTVAIGSSGIQQMGLGGTSLDINWQRWIGLFVGFPLTCFFLLGLVPGRAAGYLRRQMGHGLARCLSRWLTRWLTHTMRFISHVVFRFLCWVLRFLWIALRRLVDGGSRR